MVADSVLVVCRVVVEVLWPLVKLEIVVSVSHCSLCLQCHTRPIMASMAMNAQMICRGVIFASPAVPACPLSIQ